MYKLSVIVPVYKAEKYLSRCLESIEKQTVFNDMQLILVDDGSPDGCPEICDGFAAKHGNVLVIHKENGGVSTARNAGLEKAEGKYVGFVDADDTVAPGYFEKLLTLIEKSGCDMSFGSFILVLNNEQRHIASWYEEKAVVAPVDFAKKMLNDGSQSSVWSKLFRTAVVRDKDIRFPVGIKIGEDRLFVLSFLQHCSSAVCAGDNGYYYMDIVSSAMHSDRQILERLSVYDAETELFVSLGLNRRDVIEKKSTLLFEELADFLQRCSAVSCSNAKKAVKEQFENEELMKRIDIGLPLVKENNGRIYNMLADAFAKRNVKKTLLVLAIQNIITKIGERT